MSESLRFWSFGTKTRSLKKVFSRTREILPTLFTMGPPFATGLPHYGHLLQSYLKDSIPRFQTMKGKYVRRVWGWDTHGLPIENGVEKELGLKSKKEIEEFGIEKFTKTATDTVLRYDKDWKEIVPRLGRWVDMENHYMTMAPTYTESCWWAFSELYKKGLAYEGYKVMHICPRCETPLASSEVALNYQDTRDLSVYVKFELSR
jgi:isoleucyl-tRNA synthetase